QVSEYFGAIAVSGITKRRLRLYGAGHVERALAAVVAAVLAFDEVEAELREEAAGAGVGLGDGEAELDDGHAAARERGLADGVIEELLADAAALRARRDGDGEEI